MTKLVLLSFISSLIIGKIWLYISRKIKTFQRTSTLISKRHQKKDKTPTMGGFIFIIPTIIVSYIFSSKSKNYQIVIMVFILYAILGFIDDLIKIKKQRNEGITIEQKLLFQLIISVVFYYFYLKYNNLTILNINIKWLYGIFTLFILSSSSNAINITDGLDGLAGGICLIIFLTLGISISKLTYILSYEDITIFCFSLCGSLLGFLYYNFHPAKVFMGDLGSLALGGVLGSIILIIKKEIYLPVIAIIPVFETLSSLLQIIIYQTRKKLIFLKAPFHHHLEEKGYSETDIIKLFYLITIIACLIYLILGK